MPPSFLCSLWETTALNHCRKAAIKPSMMNAANGSPASGSCKSMPSGMSQMVLLMAISRRQETMHTTSPNPQAEPKASMSAGTGRLPTEKPPAR